MKLLVEGLDRLGKDTLIRNVLNRDGYHQVLHFSKPLKLDRYRGDLQQYQAASFRGMFSFLVDTKFPVICNRAHLGECVYAPMYRGYSGDYVFDIEAAALNGKHAKDLRLVLLTEDFKVSRHFKDDGESFDVTKRAQEQELFLAAFEKSKIKHKTIVNVTDQKTGQFRPAEEILALATSVQ